MADDSNKGGLFVKMKMVDYSHVFGLIHHVLSSRDSFSLQ